MDKSFKGRSVRQSFDWKLVIMYLLLVLIGWVNIYASIQSSEPSGILDFSQRCGKQFIWIMTALGLAVLILTVIPLGLWESGAILFYAMVVVLLVAVIFLGIDVKGSRSWFEFGPVRFQPAEISKISTSLLLAFVMSRVDFKISKFKDFLLVAFIIALPMLVILGESETGTALVYVGFIFVLYREGLSGWFLVVIAMAILLFILSMVASTYTALVVLAGMILVCNALHGKKSVRYMALFSLITVALAYLPRLWTSFVDSIIPGASIIESADVFVAETIRNSSPNLFLLQIKPLHILLVLSAITCVVMPVVAYTRKNGFIGLSVLAFIVGAVLSFSTSFIFNDVLQDHQRKRIEVLLGMKEDPSGVGYNVNQSMIAIGSGGLTGKGFMNGTQTSYGFVPEQSTDFIFCTVGEEWGFIGCAAVILLYVLIIFRLIRDAEECREHFTRIYGYCVASCIFMHLFINIGMTIGLMPVIGIPLPFMSYGGSSLWAFTVLLFIFIVLHHEEKKYF